MNSKALKQVTLSDQRESFCPSAFEGCGAVTNFTPCLPKGLKSLNRSALRGLASCTGTLEICNGDNSYDLPDGCFSGSGFEKVVFGAKFSGRIGQNNIFREMPNLRHIHILGDTNLDFALENQGHNIFDDTPYRIVVHVPAPEENASWAAVLGDSAQVAPWASLDAETKAKFRENFPGERRPKGLIVADWSSTGAQGATRTLVNRWISYESESRFIILLR